MRRILFLFLWLGLMLSASADIRPPFGLEWGESSERMEKVLANAGAKIAHRREAEGRTVWEVSGLKQEHLKQTLFYFRNGGLEEVELQYQNLAWTETHYNQFLGQLRARVDQRFGPGQLIARAKTPIEGAMMQTLVGYHWAKGQSQIEVIYFAVEQSGMAFRKVSLHYKAVY